MRTLALSIIVPVVVLMAWGLLFVVLDRFSAAESRNATKRAAKAPQAKSKQPESKQPESKQAEIDDDESGHA